MMAQARKLYVCMYARPRVKAFSKQIIAAKAEVRLSQWPLCGHGREGQFRYVF
jgi:hypothetical protein